MQIQENISLKPYNSFGINATARYFGSFCNEAELAELLAYQPKGINPLPFILGGGSNILLLHNIDGLVLKNNILGIQTIREDDDYVYVQAGAGENWHGFVLYCLAKQYAGVENLSLIPGNVGASPMQNIGAYGVEIKDVFYELQAYHLQDKKLVKFSLADCAFGYRESIFKQQFKNQFVILNVCFRLRKQAQFNTSYGAIEQELEKMGVKNVSIQAIAQAVINIRSSKLPDPKLMGNAGSFFKNPQISNTQFQALQLQFPAMVAYAAGNEHTKLAAGWLIEQCGWKGYRKGDAGCHAQQALVLVNYGQATGADIFELSEAIIQSVHKKFGVLLEREVNII